MGLSKSAPFLFRFFLFYAVLWTPAATSQTAYRVEKYNTLNGLVNDHWIKAVDTDSVGMIWMALNKGGLARFDGDVFTFYMFPVEWFERFGRSDCQSCTIDRQGKYWVNALGKILFFDSATGRFSVPNDLGGFPNDAIEGLHETRNGSIVFTSRRKLYRQLPGTTSFQLVGNIPFDFRPTISDVEEDENGHLWMLAISGYYYYPPGSTEPQSFGFQKTVGNPFPPLRPPVLHIYDSPAGNLWYADAPGKVKKLDMSGAVVEKYDLPELKYLYGIVETGDLRWFGSFDGLTKVTHRSGRFRSWLDQPFDLAQSAPTGNSCYGIAESSRGTVFTMVENTLYEISTDVPGRFRKITSTVYPRPYGLIVDRQDRIWFLKGDNSVGVYNPATNTIKRIPYEVSNEFTNTMVQGPDGKIWLPCPKSLVWIDPVTEQVQTFPLPEKESIWHIHIAEDGLIWAATTNGILKININTGEINRFTPANTPGMQSGEILSIHAANGFLWCGTTGGLIRFDPKNARAATFTTRHGLPNDHVYAAIPAEGFLWLPTNKGLARVSLASASREGIELLEVGTFGTDEGLTHHEFNTLAFLRAQNGHIWLGGLNGIIAFDPKDLVLQKSEGNSVILAEFSKYDQEADGLLNFPVFKNTPDSPFILRPKEKFFTVRFALLDYQNPKANQYSYKLEGFDPDWIFAGNDNTARYANLPPGTYKLRVRGANPNGAWSGREATATVIVEQVWYKTGWAWVLYALLTVAIAYVAWRIRVRQLRLAHQLEIEHVRAADLEKLEAFKSRFFTNVTHEFRTPLTVVLGMTEQLRSELEAQKERPGSVQVSSLLSKTTLIRRNGENLLRLVNQILDLAKLEFNTLNMNYIQGDVLAYLRYISESMHSLANARNILLRVESDQANIIMDYDPDRLLQIVHNLLSNAIKFTPSGGRVTLHASVTDGWLHMAVADTGVGISAQDLPRIFDRFFQAGNLEKAKAGGTGIGLALIKELVKLMGGEISVESKVDQGTTFKIRLPITHTASEAAQQVAELPVSHLLLPMPPADLPASDSNLPSVLLIEDNPDVLEYLATCLNGLYALHFAYNGQAGIDKALEIAPDLILSDVMMPEKTGYEVCEELKQDERTSHIPLVLLTAKADLESRIAGLRRGADAYLAKPFHPEELRLTLHNLLESRRQMQARYLDWATQETPVSTSDLAAPPAADMENEFLKKLRIIIQENLGDAQLDVEAICRKIGMSRTNLHNKLSALTGLSITLYVRKLRLLRAQELLTTTGATISEIAYEVGFNDPKFFSRVYAEEYGKPPSEARNR